VSRARARLAGRDPFDPPRARRPRRPPLITLAGHSPESFAATLLFPAAADPVVSVVIPAFNQLEYTLCCLASLSRHPPAVPFEVIVVDDASTDATRAVLALIPNLVVIRNERNLGFVRAVNRGASAARGRFLHLLNNDTQVRPGALDALVAALDDPGVGIAGSKLIYPSGHLQEAGAVLRANGTVELVGLNDDPTRPEYNRRREVDHCSGASLMIRRDLFRELGGLDEAYAPAYFEDCDLSLRVRRRGLRVEYVPASEVVHHLSVTTAGAGAETKTRQIEVNRRLLLERWGDVLARQERVRALAFYLPQFHAIPENDAWWGEGFTEWTNVRRARPLYPGHAQPRTPGDLGYYDLGAPDAREAQAALAARYGLTGFCYYYYWFNGKRLLERPLAEVLARSEPSLPFCVCWANENWTRRWDGFDDQVLIGQKYSAEDDRLFMESLLPVFADPRYIRIDGRPLFLVYRVQLLPDVRATAERWRQVCREAGVAEPYLVSVHSVHSDFEADPREWGFDAAVEFPPHGGAVETAAPEGYDRSGGGRFFDYARSAARFATRALPRYPLFRAVMPSWDNSPRRGERANVFLGSSPAVFERWLAAMVRQTRHLKHGDERIVFINAWNEWGEGNYLEPDQERGREYLRATARALTGADPD
jgi:GT2 family glycosyltransferase